MNIDRSAFLALVASIASITLARTGDAQDAPQSPGGPPIAVVPGVDVLGVHIGMSASQASAASKKKGFNLLSQAAMGPAIEGLVGHAREADLATTDSSLSVNLTRLTLPQVVHAVWHMEQKPMLEATVVSALRSKYGAQGIDVGVTPTKEFVRVETKESCLKAIVDKDGDCKAALARRKDSDPQHLRACNDEREKECKPYLPAARQPLMGGHAITWHYDEHGHPLSQDAFERYCPTTTDRCKAITVVAQFGAEDAVGTVQGYSVQLQSDWLLKFDNDEQNRRQAAAQAEAEKKRREQELNTARQNRPQL